jgi:hypothetical protein
MDCLISNINASLLNDKKVQHNITRFCSAVMSNIYMCHWVNYGPLTCPPLLPGEEPYFLGGAQCLLKLIISVISNLPQRIEAKRVTINIAAALKGTAVNPADLNSLHSTLHDCMLHLFAKQVCVVLCISRFVVI